MHCDAVVTTHLFICIPQGMQLIVYSAHFISHLVFLPSPDLHLPHANGSKLSKTHFSFPHLASPPSYIFSNHLKSLPSTFSTTQFFFLASLVLLLVPARPQPTSRPTVPQKDVQARQVLLSWEPGSDGLSPVRYYTVQLRELPDNNWTVHSASVNHEATSYIVSRWSLLL